MDKNILFKQKPVDNISLNDIIEIIKADSILLSKKMSKSIKLTIDVSGEKEDSILKIEATY